MTEGEQGWESCTSLIAFLIAGLSAAALRQKAPERTATTHEVIEQPKKLAV